MPLLIPTSNFCWVSLNRGRFKVDFSGLVRKIREWKKGEKSGKFWGEVELPVYSTMFGVESRDGWSCEDCARLWTRLCNQEPEFSNSFTPRLYKSAVNLSVTRWTVPHTRGFSPRFWSQIFLSLWTILYCRHFLMLGHRATPIARLKPLFCCYRISVARIGCNTYTLQD